MAFHLVWIIIMILSIPIVIIFPSLSLAILLLPLTMIVLWIVYSSTCPITDLEKKLLNKSEENKAYSGSFITHYLKKFLKIKVTDRQVDTTGYVLTGLLVLNAINYYLL